VLEDALNGRKATKFTLQWHLTHACDLHCKHCYDRSKVFALRLEQARAVLDDFEVFCAARDVAPNVYLSGGNPFFYPWFFELYQDVADRGLPVSILGNPVERETLERLCAITTPRYFQVSLEGLQPHNDDIRGDGFFDKVLAFLPLLDEFGIKPVVMTTLTRGNMDQIVPLSEVLRDKAGRFTWNRLSQTGEGANLALPSKEDYGAFMVEWMAARKDNPKLGLKDNLFNIFRHELGLSLSGGCTGVGCGAAFNFVAVLPNGDVHACRKFPSPIGNLLENDLGTIFDSAEAQKYRRGCEACDGCPIRHRCGGCLAVTAGQGLDPFKDVDPYCFMND